MRLWWRKAKCSRQGAVVDATLTRVPSSTKDNSGKRDPEMHQTHKGGKWYFGMKAHIRVDVESGLVHTVVGTAANVHESLKKIGGPRP
jgi:transposase, IS5 family